MKFIFLFVLVFHSCSFDSINGTVDKNLLDFELSPIKTTYENGSIIEVDAIVKNRTGIVPVYYWYIDGQYVYGQVSSSFYKFIEHDEISPKIYNITLKIKAAKYIAYKKIDITVNNRTLANFDLLIDNDNMSETILYLSEAANFSIDLHNSNDAPFSYNWKINNDDLTESSSSYVFVPDRVGKFVITAIVTNNNTAINKSAIVYVIKENESKVLIRKKDLSDKVIFEFGKVDIIETLIKTPAHTPTSLEWYYKDISSNGDFIKSENNNSTKFIFPNDKARPIEDKNYLIKVVATVGSFYTEDSVVLIIKGNKPPIVDNILEKSSWTLFEIINNYANFKISAKDYDNDKLMYKYKINSGEIINIEDKTTFMLPSDLTVGNHQVTIFVDDNNYHTVEKNYSIEVLSSNVARILQFKNSGDQLVKLSNLNNNNIYFLWTNALNNNVITKKVEKNVVEKKSRAIFFDNAVGMKKKFKISSSSKKEYEATLRKQTELISTKYGEKSLEVWVSNDCYFDGGTKRVLITDEMLDKFVSTLLKAGDNNDLYDYITSILGEEWSSSAKIINPYLIGEQNTIAVLLCDIDDDNKISIDDGATLGLFEKEDTYWNKSNSDGKLMVNLDALLFVSEYELVLSTFAHEFAHLITYYQKEILNLYPNYSCDRWLEELISMVTEDIIASKIDVKGPRGLKLNESIPAEGISTGRIPFFNKSPYNQVNAAVWSGPDSYDSYGIVYAFGSYIIRNFNNPNLLKNILGNTGNGFDAIIGGLHLSGYNQSLSTLLSNWGIAVLLSDYSDLPETSFFRTNSISNFNYANFSLGTINFFDYKYGVNKGFIFNNVLPSELRKNSNNIISFENQTGNFEKSVYIPNGVMLTVVVK